MTKTPALQRIKRAVGKRATGRKQAELIREIIADAKAGGCVLCGYKKCLAALEFHHVSGGKSFEMSGAGSRSIATVQAEIAKCIVVCSNCHREIHSEQLGLVNRTDTNDEDTELMQGDLFM